MSITQTFLEFKSRVDGQHFPNISVIIQSHNICKDNSNTAVWIKYENRKELKLLKL